MKSYFGVSLALALFSSGVDATQFSLITDSELLVQGEAGTFNFQGARVFGKFERNDGVEIFAAQADFYEFNDIGASGKPRMEVVLSGNVVISDGLLTLAGKKAVFDIESNEIVITGLEQANKTGGVLTYSCQGTRLYRNGQRVDGDTDLVCGGASYCIMYKCNSRGELVARIVMQEP